MFTECMTESFKKKKKLKRGLVTFACINYHKLPVWLCPHVSWVHPICRALSHEHNDYSVLPPLEVAL